MVTLPLFVMSCTFRHCSVLTLILSVASTPRLASPRLMFTCLSTASQFKHYPGTYHGFAIRGDKRRKDVRDATIRESQAEV